MESKQQEQSIGEPRKEKVPVKRSRGTAVLCFRPEAPASRSCSLERTRSPAGGPDARGFPVKLAELQLTAQGGPFQGSGEGGHLS